MFDTSQKNSTKNGLQTRNQGLMSMVMLPHGKSTLRKYWTHRIFCYKVFQYDYKISSISPKKIYKEPIIIRRLKLGYHCYRLFL